LKPTRLKPLFEDLASQSVSDLYYVPKSLTEKIKQAIITAPLSHDSKKILKNEMAFIYLQCEMDETVISNGEECYLFDVAIGQELPDDIKDMLSNV
jgi:hypothetical protein